MQQGLTIKIVDVDPEYLGIEIFVSNQKFAGSTRIYAGLTELTAFANQIAKFPSNAQDERRYAFGKPDQRFAGGFCDLYLHCTDSAGHARLDVDIADDDVDEPAAVKLGFPVLAADIDQFTLRLREIELGQAGQANLPLANYESLVPSDA